MEKITFNNTCYILFLKIIYFYWNMEQFIGSRRLEYALGMRGDLLVKTF